MTKSLPSKSNLKQLRNQAREILNAHKNGDASCCVTLRHLTKFKGLPDKEILAAPLKLAEVQYALALDYGFESWGALKGRVHGINASERGERLLEEAIEEAMEDEEDVTLFSSWFTDATPTAVARDLNAFTQKMFGRHIVACHLLDMNVGVRFGLTLDNEESIWLRVNGPEESTSELMSMHNITQDLHSAGFPCPRALCPPTRIGDTTVTVHECIDEGVRADAYRPEIRRSMAQALAAHIEISRKHVSTAKLPHWGHRPTGALWGKPHNLLFDFDRYPEAAKPIDAIAQDVIDIAESSCSPTVVGHSHWAVTHFRFNADRITVIDDWTSLRLGTEAQILANAAVSFTYVDRPGENNMVTPPEHCTAFVREYEDARGKPFTSEELESIAAAGTYAVAYRARCAHSYGGSTRGACFVALTTMPGRYYFEL